MQQLRLFFIALQFFTRLPIPAWVGFEASWLQHASRYFPLVGCVVAAIAAAVYYAAALVLPAPVAAVLSTAASIYRPAPSTKTASPIPAMASAAA
jgi:adenosylcobinamide-GDP ribazoletransferase